MILQAQNPRRRTALPRFAGIIPAGYALEIKCLLRSRLISCVHSIMILT